MTVEHVEFHVEEPSMEALLRGLLPRVLTTVPFDIYTYQGKPDLLKELPVRLKGLATWLPATWRVVVIVDVDRDDCAELRARLDGIVVRAGMRVRSGNGAWQVVNRIAIEELEAWYFGDWEAVRTAFPRVPDVSRRREFRDPDAIAGGTWEAFERVLQAAGYFRGGLQKTMAARQIGEHLDAERNTSTSFGKLCEVLRELTS